MLLWLHSELTEAESSQQHDVDQVLDSGPPCSTLLSHVQYSRDYTDGAPAALKQPIAPRSGALATSCERWADLLPSLLLGKVETPTAKAYELSLLLSSTRLVVRRAPRRVVGEAPFYGISGSDLGKLALCPDR